MNDATYILPKITEYLKVQNDKNIPKLTEFPRNVPKHYRIVPKNKKINYNYLQKSENIYQCLV